MQHRRIHQMGWWGAAALGAAPWEGLQAQQIAAEGLDYPGVLTPLEQTDQPVAAAVEAAPQTMPESMRWSDASQAGCRGWKAEEGKIPRGHDRHRAEHHQGATGGLSQVVSPEAERRNQQQFGPLHGGMGRVAAARRVLHR